MNQSHLPEHSEIHLRNRAIFMRATIVLFVSSLILWIVQSPQIWQRDTIVYAQAERRRLMAEALEKGFPSYEQWRDNLLKENSTLFYKDGICANVAVSSGGNPPVRSLFTNGHPDASDGGDIENQILLACLPLLLNPDTKDVCVVGWGSGVTAGYALRFPIKKLVCAEIEPSVIDTSKLFAHVNYSPELDPRTKIVPADGRNFLLCTDEKFDLIISEPSNPWQSGVCNLFTREYFQICKNRLSTGGSFCFWSQVTEMPTKNLTEILAALREVFPYIFVFDSGRGDICAIAMNEPRKISLKNIDQTLTQTPIANPKLSEEAPLAPSIATSAKSALDKGAQSTSTQTANAPAPQVPNSLPIGRILWRTGIGSAEDLVSRIYMCPEGVTNAVRGRNLNTDDRNHLEFEIARSYENRIYRTQNIDFMNSNHGPIWDYVSWRRSDKQAKALELAAVANKCIPRNTALAEVWANQSLDVFQNSSAYYCLIQNYLTSENLQKAIAVSQEAHKNLPGDPYLMDLQGTAFSRALDCAKAQNSFEQAVLLDPVNPLFKFHLAQTYSKLYVGEKRLPHCTSAKSNPTKVIALCREISTDRNFLAANPSVLLLLADAYLRDGKFQNAIPILELAVQYNVRASIAWGLLSEACQRAALTIKSKSCEERAHIFAQFELGEMRKEATLLIKEGNFRNATGLLQSILETDPSDEVSRKLLTRMAETEPLAIRVQQELDQQQQHDERTNQRLQLPPPIPRIREL